ncbi:unnamed protein product [Sphagnum compactum]
MNKNIVAQITYATRAGDIVLMAAYANELPCYGLKAYCTGLLLACRHLKKFELDEDYPGNETVWSIKTVLQLLRDDEPEKYQAHFSGLVKEGLEANNLAEMYTSVHAAIHADPTAQTTEKRAPSEKKMWKMKKLSYGERKAVLISQLNALKEQDDQERN